jgi:hypothetical protein
MGRTGAAAHGVRVVFASCSRLRTALTFMLCIICFCGDDESITFVQVCVRITCIIYFAIFAVVFAVCDCGWASGGKYGTSLSVRNVIHEESIKVSRFADRV